MSALNRDKQNKMDELMVINTWICLMSLRADIPNMVIRGTQLRLLKDIDTLMMFSFSAFVFKKIVLTVVLILTQVLAVSLGEG